VTVPLKQVLGRVVDRLGIGRRTREYRAVVLWDEAVGPAVARRARAERVVGGVLYAAAQSPVWAQQLSFLRPELVRRVNEAVGERVVTDVRFHCHARVDEGRAGEEGGGKESVSGVRPRAVELDESERASLQRAGEPIGDPRLRQSFCNLARVDRLNSKYRLSRGGCPCRSCGAICGPGQTLCPTCRLRPGGVDSDPVRSPDEREE